MRVRSLDHLVLTVQDIGAVRRTGAAAFPIDSLYVRDPDGNLAELSVRASS